MQYTRHSEPFASLEDKLREESYHFRINETLRCAQGDYYGILTDSSRENKNLATKSIPRVALRLLWAVLLRPVGA